MIDATDHVRVAVRGPDAQACIAWCQARGARAAPLGSPDDPTDDVTVLIVDEWTAESAPHVVAARAAGIRVTVLAELLLTATPRRVVAVTGTAGKTTTTRLIAAMLAASGLDPLIASHGRAENAWPNHSLVGPATAPGGWLVVELTSTHLCYMDTWRGPDVAVLNNLWPDHVELHGSIEGYAAAKRRLFTRPDGCIVVNADDTTGLGLLGATTAARRATFSQRAPVRDGAWLAPNGVHLMHAGQEVGHIPWDVGDSWIHPGAALAASAAAACCGARGPEIADALTQAPQLPHRFHTVGVIDGIRVIDDSMASTPTKARAALDRIPPSQLILLAGGIASMDTGTVHASHPERLALRQACRRAIDARALITFGPGGRVIDDVVGRSGCVPTLDDAIAQATALARPADTILLAPMFPMDQPDRARFAQHTVDALRQRPGGTPRP